MDEVPLADRVSLPGDSLTGICVLRRAVCLHGLSADLHLATKPTDILSPISFSFSFPLSFL